MSFRPVTCIVTALLVGPAVLLSAAPTAADPPSPPAPDPTAATGTTATPAAASATMTTTARRRGLRVQVARPVAARKRVKVRVVGPRLPNGKRFRATIRRTRTWKNARPGVYRIRAKTIRFRDQRIVPRISRKKVRIRADRARKRAVVRYAKPVFCQRGGTRLFAWGDNDFGQLGIARRADRLRPLANRWLRGVTAVTGGLRSTYALCRDGSVWAWGYNGNGELGINRGGNRLWPVRVAGLRNITAIAAADQSAYALRADGTVWAWGSGRYGELGDGTSGVGRLSAKPVKVQLPGPASTIAAGGYSAYAALRGSGEVYAWGNGGVGQRGDGTTGESTPTPVRVTGLTGVAELAAGHVTAYARTASGMAYAWGSNNQGEIRLGLGAVHSTPLFLGSGASVIGASHSAGYAFVDGTDVYSWGSGRYKDVGRDTGGGPAMSLPIPGLTDVAALAGAGYGAYALRSDGTVWSWGDNQHGQLGTGAARTGPSHNTGGLLPAPITGLSGVTAIGAGRINGYAIR